MLYKLGRKAVKRDSRQLMLRDYLTPALPAAPAVCDWTKGVVNWGMMLNDTLGDCTIAGCAHAVQVWTLNSAGVYAGMVTIPDSAIEQAYSAWDGYVPGDPSTDTGGVELDVLNDWRKNGFAGHNLMAFADPSVSNQMEIQQSIYLFGGLYIGFQVPSDINEAPGSTWDVSDAPIEGGHCVYIAGYDPEGLTVISWGSIYRMTWAFWQKYVDEAHALLSPDWLVNNVDPAGVNLVQLQADLAAIR